MSEKISLDSSEKEKFIPLYRQKRIVFFLENFNL